MGAVGAEQELGVLAEETCPGLVWYHKLINYDKMDTNEEWVRSSATSISILDDGLQFPDVFLVAKVIQDLH